MNPNAKHSLRFVLTLLCFYSISGNVYAQFNANFEPVGEGSMSTSAYRDTCGSGCGWKHNMTPTLTTDDAFGFIGERVFDANGQAYNHFIIGDEESGFIQEVYIQVIGENVYSGGVDYKWDRIAIGGAIQTGPHPGSDPLGINSPHPANASADPNKVIVRQFMADGGIQQEFFKSKIGKKPRITQTTTDAAEGFYSYVEIDMSHIDINQIAEAKMVNRIDMEGDEFDFDFEDYKNNEGANVNINAGKYVYIPGNPNEGGAAGTYIYVDGGEGVKDTNWAAFFDHSQDNPWYFEGQKPEKAGHIID